MAAYAGKGRSSTACPIRKPDTNYLVRFTAPEFTSLCPVTGQPDFAHLVIDYVPGRWLLESKSLKLYVASFRNHGAFHEDCTVMIGKRIADEIKPQMAADRRLLVSARRHPDRRVLADRPPAEGHVGPRSGRRALSRARLKRFDAIQSGSKPLSAIRRGYQGPVGQMLAAKSRAILSIPRRPGRYHSPAQFTAPNSSSRTESCDVPGGMSPPCQDPQ